MPPEEAQKAEATTQPTANAQTEATAPVAATEVDIFDKPAGEIDSGHGGGGEAYKATLGMHMATVVAVAYLGHVTSTFEGVTKTQEKVQFLFALADQTVVFTEEGKPDNDTGEPVTITSAPYTLSFHEKAALHKLYKGLGKKVETTTTVSEMLNTKCVIFVAAHHETGRPIINSINPGMPKGQPDPEKAVYLPKFWLVGADGKPTGFKIRTNPKLVIEGERPKQEQKA